MSIMLVSFPTLFPQKSTFHIVEDLQSHYKRVNVDDEYLREAFIVPMKNWEVYLGIYCATYDFVVYLMLVGFKKDGIYKAIHKYDDEVTSMINQMVSEPEYNLIKAIFYCHTERKYKYYRGEWYIKDRWWIKVSNESDSNENYEDEYDEDEYEEEY